MFILQGEGQIKGMHFIDTAAQIARHSPCFRSRCGTVIVKNNQIIGRGYNAPPRNEKIDQCIKDSLPKNFKSDKTCCIHAEQRAIMDALTHYPKEIVDARLYFIRLDEEGNKKQSGDPYCTICSKMALDSGIAEFVLWRKEGLCVYDTHEYNTLSFAFNAQ